MSDTKSDQDLDEMTRDDLYEIAQDEDIEGRSSMTREELLDAVRDAQSNNAQSNNGETKEGETKEGESKDGSGKQDDDDGGSGDTKPKMKPVKAVREASRQLHELVGYPVEGVSSMRGDGDGGWELELVVLELERIPRSTDVLGTYAVVIDADGDVVSFERVRRTVRAQVENDR